MVRSVEVDKATSKDAMVVAATTAAAAAVGRVLWINECFESLAGVDAVDVVGQQLASLFEVSVGEGEKLLQSLEIGKVRASPTVRQCTSSQKVSLASDRRVIDSSIDLPLSSGF